MISTLYPRKQERAGDSVKPAWQKSRPPKETLTGNQYALNAEKSESEWAWDGGCVMYVFLQYMMRKTAEKTGLIDSN